MRDDRFWLGTFMSVLARRALSLGTFGTADASAASAVAGGITAGMPHRMAAFLVNVMVETGRHPDAAAAALSADPAKAAKLRVKLAQLSPSWCGWSKTPIGNANMPLANVLRGTLAVLATQVSSYWPGFSSGSPNKDGLLQEAQNKLANSIPTRTIPRPGAIIFTGMNASHSEASNLNSAELAHIGARP